MVAKISKLYCRNLTWAVKTCISIVDFTAPAFGLVRGGGTPGLRRGFLSRSLGWLIRGIWFLCRVLLITWAVLAIYYSNLPLAGLRLALAMSFAALAIWLLWISRGPRAPLFFIVLFLGVVAWWISIPPSHDRPWRPEVAVMPRATIDGDRVHITGVRNFEYRGLNDFTAHYEERDLRLSHMTGLDSFVP